MHEKEFEAKRQQPLLAVYSQSASSPFTWDQQGQQHFLFLGPSYSPIPGAGKPGVLPC